MNSSYYLNLKNKYISIKNKLNSSFVYFDNCIDIINDGNIHFEKMVVDGKNFDDGKLLNEMSIISNIRENMQILVSECNRKIDECEALYREALNKENKEKKDE